MSSRDGLDMESWLQDSLFGIGSDDPKFQQIIVLLEPYRDSLENAIFDFDEENQSWRDYRNALWSYIDPEIDDQINRILHGN